MKKNTIWIAAGVIVVGIIIALLIFLIPAKDTLTVISDDGAAKLEIPVAALSKDVKPDQLAVKRGAGPLPEGTGDTEFYEYVLEPDGLELKSEAKLTVNLANPNLSVPQVYHLTSNGQGEAVNNVITDIAIPSGDTTVAVPLTHFSSVVINTSEHSRFFTVSGTVADTPVGQKVNAQTTVALTQEASSDIAHFERWDKDKGEWVYTPFGSKMTQKSVNVQGEIVGALERLEPQVWPTDKPAQTSLSKGELNIPINEYTCEEVGSAQIMHKMNISWEQQSLNVDYPPEHPHGTVIYYDPYTHNAVVRVQLLFQCTGSQGGETGTAGTVGGTGVSQSTPTIEMAFDHVKPGQYSEVYLSVTTKPGTEVQATLGGPSVQPPAQQSITADDNGLAYFVWRIYSYGQYNATITIGSNTKYPWHKSVVVQ